MTTELWPVAEDDGTYTLHCEIKDPDGDEIPAADISSILWTLTDNAGNVINGRSDVAPAIENPLEIVLGAADLDYSDGAERLITVTVVYDLGTLVDSASFTIEDPDAVSTACLRDYFQTDLDDVFYNECEHAEAADYQGNNILVVETGGDHMIMVPGYDLPAYVIQIKESDVPNPKAGDMVDFRGRSYYVGPMIRSQRGEWIVDLMKHEAGY